MAGNGLGSGARRPTLFAGTGGLPLPLTPLIARDQEQEALVALLRDPTVRLLTMTGPGGVGKTRLAIAAAADVADDFSDGVNFVNLAPITNPDLVLDSIAGTLGLRDMGGESLHARLIGVLNDKRMLLVLDNFEQVVTAGPRVRDLAAICPELTLLITSRTRLRVSGEREFPVSPLPLRAPTAIGDAEISGAVRLFCERAQAIRPDFRLTAETLPAVAEIVSRVDGLPLAIELAAARMKALPPVTILERLEQRLPLLRGGPRDLPLRQQTMRDTIAWSYNLLTPAEQLFFRQFAVFVGGFTLDAAEAISAGAMDASGERRSSAPFDVVDGITALIDHSLLRQSAGPGNEPRYQMLETVREFGLERLAASGETEEYAVRGAHAAYALTLAEPVREWPFPSGYLGVLTRLDAELDNVRAALEWAERVGEAELGLWLAGSMGYYWMMRGHYREGRDWLERTLRHADQAPATPRAYAMNLAGALAAFQGDCDVAAGLLTEAIRLAQNGEDWLRAGMALVALGLTELQRGDYVQAAARTEEGIPLLLLVEDTAIASPPALSRAYANLGRIAFAQKEFTRAATALEESLGRARALDFTWVLGDTLRSLGDLARERGDYERALACYRESVALARDHGDPNFLGMTLAGIAAVAVKQGRPEPAVRLAAAAAALREQIGVPVEEWQRATYVQGMELARSTMPPEMFSTLWAEGFALPAEAVVAEALAVASPTASSNETSLPPDVASMAGLTPREIEVLRLLAEGLSDREIAAALSISERTTGNHVLHILQKLDVDSRTAAAVFAVRHNLA